jgi:large subunit ribosomal protein L23
MKHPRDIILRPIITEKAAVTNEGEQEKVTFKVHPTAGKREIAGAVEAIFGVKVTSVNTMHVSGKPRRLGRFTGRQSNWKKAVVTLAGGDTINLFEG